MSVQLFTLIPQSNLHAGAGSSNYGVIDNLVQRDVTDQYPTVFASSLKGAFREYYEKILKKNTEMESVFGGIDKKGGYIFSDAHLLALPVRSNQKPYFMATCPSLLQKFVDVVVKDFNFSNKVIEIIQTEVELIKNKVLSYPTIIGKSISNLSIEDFDNVKDMILGIPTLQKILGNDIVIFSDDDMKYQCSDYALPILARNCLDNGHSTNLWYEQIIPRKTVFYFLAENLTSTHNFDIGNKLVQVGGNATVGYGRCQINQL